MDKLEGCGRLTVAVIASFMLASLAGPAEAHRRPDRWWQYHRRISRHASWSHHAELTSQHSRWHQEHTVSVTREETGEDGETRTVARDEPTFTTSEHDASHHQLWHDHLWREHRFRIAGRQSGTAAWYAMEGRRGACGKVLEGMYAAHRTWPCGSLVAVQRGDRVVRVRIMDRGPFVSGWIIDVSRSAMRRIAGERGTAGVTIYLLKRG